MCANFVFPGFAHIVLACDSVQPDVWAFAGVSQFVEKSAGITLLPKGHGARWWDRHAAARGFTATHGGTPA